MRLAGTLKVKAFAPLYTFQVTLAIGDEDLNNQSTGYTDDFGQSLSKQNLRSYSSYNVKAAADLYEDIRMKGAKGGELM